MIPTDPNTLARRLRAALADADTDVSHAAALELVARQLGFRDWNTAAAAAPPAAEPVAVPILRTYPGEEADRFYLDWLGFAVDWEHRFEPGLPLYRQVSRDGCVLHLSEHHGDATPGGAVRIRVADVHALSARLVADDRVPLRPGVERREWGDDCVVPDPFGNRLVFTTLR